MRVVILYDPGADDWTAEDVAGVMEAVDHIARIFIALNHQVQRVPVRHDMRWFNICRRADLVFNLCEGVDGVSHDAGERLRPGGPPRGCGRTRVDPRSDPQSRSHRRGWPVAHGEGR